MNWALFGKFRQSAGFRREIPLCSQSALTTKNSFGCNERQPAGDVDPAYEETLVQSAIDSTATTAIPLRPSRSETARRTIERFQPSVDSAQA